jgi:hypothetical protein
MKWTIKHMSLIFILMPLILFAQDRSKSGAYLFQGQEIKITYRKGRKIHSCTFLFHNKSRESISITLEKALLVRGFTEEVLKKASFNSFSKNQKKKSDEMEIRAGEKRIIKIAFQGFEFYPGYSYSIKAFIRVHEETLNAVSVFMINKSQIKDKNFIKE